MAAPADAAGPAVTVVNVGDDEDGTHRATIRGHGMTIKMRLREDTPAMSASAAAELATAWAGMLVELTGGDPYG